MLFCTLFICSCQANTEKPITSSIEEEELTDEGPFNGSEGPDGLVIEVPWLDNWYVLKMPNDDRNFKIYDKATDVENLIYDSAQQEEVEDLEDYHFMSRFYVEDANGDGTEEFYLFFEDFFEEPYEMVLTYQDDYLKTSYFGYGESIFAYEDIDEDGVMELITPHPSGGGMVTVWQGLDLVNVYDPEMQTYVFSYPLTRKKYEVQNKTLDRQLNVHLSPEGWEKLLESYADLGEPQTCKDLIEMSQSLEELNVHPDWQGPYETYFEYVVARAEYYQEIWQTLKGDDSADDSDGATALPGALTEADFELSNGLYADMSYTEFCDIMNYSGALEFSDDGSGFSSSMASVDLDGLSASFVWPSSDASDPVLFGYVIKEPTIFTKRGAGVGMPTEELVELYGDPVSQSDWGLEYRWNQYTLLFELAGDKVGQIKMIVNP